MAHIIPFTEKYRPGALSDICLPKRISCLFTDGLRMNYLFFGPAGTGKTSLAKILVQENGMPYLYINASAENSVEVVRNKIESFCSSSSILFGTPGDKVVILDEFDYFSASAYAALRASIEKYACYVRFIATCNYVDRIPEPVRSRFKEISFDFMGEDEVKDSVSVRLQEIAESEGRKIMPDACILLIEKCFPDMRRMVSELQNLMLTYCNDVIKAEHVMRTVTDEQWLFRSVLDENVTPQELFETVMAEYVNTADAALDTLGRPLIKYILNDRADLIWAIPELTTLAGKYQFQYASSLDKSICLLACMSEMRAVFERTKNKK